MTNSRAAEDDDGTGQYDDAAPGDDRRPVRRDVLRAVAATGAASALAGCGGGGSGGGSNNAGSGGNSGSGNSGGGNSGGGSTATPTATTVVPDCDDYETLSESDVNGGATLEAGCYRIEDTHEIDAGTLALEPGVLIEFGEGAGIRVEDDAGLDARGTDREPVFLRGGTADRGFWQGIGFTGDASSTSVVEHTVVAHAGGGPWYGDSTTTAALFAEDVSLEVRNSYLHHNAGKALMSREPGTDLTVAETRFEANAVPVWIPGNLFGAFDSSNEIAGNDDNRVYVQGRAGVGSADVTRDQQWDDPGVPLFLNQEQVVAASLTIGPGVAFDVGETHGFEVEGGQLDVMGVDGNPVRFRGDQRERGYWHGIGYQEASGPNRIQYAVIKDAGSDPWNGDSTTQSALFAEDVTLDVQTSSLSNNAATALLSRDGETDLTVTDTRFEGNESPVRLHANLVGGFDPSNVVEDNDDDRIAVRGSTSGGTGEVTTGQTWETPGVPFHVRNGVDLQATLVVGQGVTVDFDENVGIDAHGARLEANGTADDRIRFRGDRRERGFWRGVRFGDATEGNLLRNVVVADAGGHPWRGTGFSAAGVFVQGSGVEVHLDSCAIQNNAVSGVTATGRGYDFTVENCVFQGNAVPVWTNADLVGNFTVTNAYAGNDASHFRVGIRGARSVLQREATWPDRGIPYRLVRDLRVNDALTIDPGVTVESGGLGDDAPTVKIEVPFGEAGSLEADASGTAEETIVFTGAEDEAGYWGGIHFSTEERSNTLRDVVVEYAGGSPRNGDSESYAAVTVWEFGEVVAADLSEVALKDSAQHGIYKACDSELSCGRLSFEGIQGSEFWDADDDAPVGGCNDCESGGSSLPERRPDAVWGR